MAALMPDLQKVEAHIVEMTNTVRRDEKLAPVKIDPVLAKAAKAFADYLARTGKFAHDADGSEPGKRADGAGYKFCEIAENLALHQDSRGFEARDLAGKAMTGWVNSPGHRANIMSPHVTDIGVGISRSADADPKYISVQLFARPASAAYEFQIANTAKTAVSYTFAGKAHDIAPHLSVTHQACRPGDLVFSAPGGLVSSAKEIGRFAAEDGKLYTLKPAPDGRVLIDVGKRQNIR